LFGTHPSVANHKAAVADPDVDALESDGHAARLEAADARAHEHGTLAIQID
jgi:hypothetical protein